ncbi:hypothetical protein GCM10028786_05430 [Flaviaesturariibacter terrae]
MKIQSLKNQTENPISVNFIFLSDPIQSLENSPFLIRIPKIRFNPILKNRFNPILKNRFNPILKNRSLTFEFHHSDLCHQLPNLMKAN